MFEVDKTLLSSSWDSVGDFGLETLERKDLASTDLAVKASSQLLESPEIVVEAALPYMYPVLAPRILLWRCLGQLGLGGGLIKLVAVLESQTGGDTSRMHLVSFK